MIAEISSVDSFVSLVLGGVSGENVREAAQIFPTNECSRSCNKTAPGKSLPSFTYWAVAFSSPKGDVLFCNLLLLFFTIVRRKSSFWENLSRGPFFGHAAINQSILKKLT